MGLSHRKGNPWRVNPFRASTRAQAGLVMGCNRGGRSLAASLYSVISTEFARSQEMHSCPGDPGGFKPP